MEILENMRNVSIFAHPSQFVFPPERDDRRVRVLKAEFIVDFAVKSAPMSLNNTVGEVASASVNI